MDRTFHICAEIFGVSKVETSLTGTLLLAFTEGVLGPVMTQA